MANSKFSGAGFADGLNATTNSVFVGYESGVNRRWTAPELFSTEVQNATGVTFVLSPSQKCRINHNGLSAINGSIYNQSILGYTIVADTSTSVSSDGISFKTTNALNEIMTIKEEITSLKNHEFQSGIKDNVSSLGTSGQVLSSTGSGVQWINAGGSTPTLQDVVNASAPLPMVNDQGGNTSWIEFQEGSTTNRLTIGRDGGTGPFGIACSQGTFSIQGATFQSFSIQTGASASRAILFSYPTSGNSVAEFTNQMDIRLSASTAFKCGPSNTPGTAGQVLTSTGTSVEWATPSPTTYIGQQGTDVEFYTDSFITIKWDETNNDIELRVNDWGTASSLNAMDRQDGLSSVEPDNTNIPSSTGTATFTPISPLLGVNERAEILVAPIDFPWPTDTAGTTNWPTYKIEVMNNGSTTSQNFYAIITKYNN